MSGTDTIERGAIAEAYESLAERPGAFVSVLALRLALGGRVRNLDAALTGMYREQIINLTPQSDQAALTEAQRAAAVRIGGEDKHRMSWEG